MGVLANTNGASCALRRASAAAPLGGGFFFRASLPKSSHLALPFPRPDSCAVVFYLDAGACPSLKGSPSSSGFAKWDVNASVSLRLTFDATGQPLTPTDACGVPFQLVPFTGGAGGTSDCSTGAYLRPTRSALSSRTPPPYR